MGRTDRKIFTTRKLATLHVPNTLTRDDGPLAENFPSFSPYPVVEESK